MKRITLALLLLMSMTAVSQTSISGKVVDEKNQPISGANVVLQGENTGATTNFYGLFEFEVTQVPPFTIVVSSVSYKLESVEITAETKDITIILKEGAELDEVIISASRTPERIFESPVSIEHIGRKEIKNTPSVDFFNGLENLKGVDINTGSLNFKSINTRGFADFSNVRFVQLIDGMDNSSPGLNFALGNLLGINELDVERVELLPGASSALYGANAFNGILFMTSKNPFDHQGISAYIKTGITSQEAAGDNEFYDYGVRVAHAFSDKFAAKANFSYSKATDWVANSTTNKNNAATDRSSDINYNGLNVYGDDFNVGLDFDALAGAPEGTFGNAAVSRTGYDERDLLGDGKAKSIKFDAAFHYRPFANDLEFIYSGRIAKGASVFHGFNRYALRDFFIQQHKLEIKNDNFFIRAYKTIEDAGDSYDTGFTGINLNRQWKDDNTWFGQYAGTYIQSVLAGQNSTQAHANARQTADTGRFLPGTPEFNQALGQVTNDTNLITGSKFQDETSLGHIDANYNFSHLTKDFADIQIGGSFREYKLNSSGTIYTDADGPIRYSEFGIYTQVQKKLMDERLKVTASVRYDKSELFDGNFSPRVSLGYTLGEERNHNIRASVQTGFRNPTTQELFIGLNVGPVILTGSAASNLDRDSRSFALSAAGAGATGVSSVNVTPRAAFENAFSLSSVQNGTFQATTTNTVKPEKVTAFEVGYRGKINRFNIDGNIYYNQYKDFISIKTVVVPLYGQAGDGALSLFALQNGDTQAYRPYVNSVVDISSLGATIGVSTKILGGFDVGVNYTYAEQDFDQAKDPDFSSNFNTPKHKVKGNFGHRQLFKNFGFNTTFRWSDDYLWEAPFANGPVPAYFVVDAQVNYTIPFLKSMLKVGATNLGGDEYFTAYGTGLIGSQYYVGLTINNL